MFDAVRLLARRVIETARLMVGVPDYAAYLARRRQFSATASVMSHAEFVRYCSERRLGGRGPGGCC
jgi:uncharacterized short protein YbdD (DUF466 family)